MATGELSAGSEADFEQNDPGCAKIDLSLCKLSHCLLSKEAGSSGSQQLLYRGKHRRGVLLGPIDPHPPRFSCLFCPESLSAADSFLNPLTSFTRSPSVSSSVSPIEVCLHVVIQRGAAGRGSLAVSVSCESLVPH